MSQESQVTEDARTQKRVVQVGELFENMPLTKAHWKAGSTLFLALAVDGWEMMILVLNSASIMGHFAINESQLGLLMSALYLAMIPGCLMWGVLMDKFGRKKTLIYGFIIYGIFSLISAFSVNYEMLWALRFLAGIGLAGAVTAVFPYFEELIPVKTRGRATVYLASGFPLGTLMAIGVTALVTKYAGGSWQWAIGVSSLASLWAFAVAAVPESPYWLAGHGLQEKAKEVIKYLSHQDKATIDKLAQVDLTVEKVKKGSYIEIFRKGYAKMTVVQTITNFVFSWGYWGLSSWMPVLLAQKGLSAGSSLQFLALSALLMFPGYITSSYLTGKFGRKKVMAVFVAMAAAAGFGLASSTTLTHMYIWNFTLSFFSLGAWGVWDTWFGEIYPTNIRGVGYAFGMTAQRIANTVAPTVIGAMVAVQASFYGTVSFISIFLVITFIAVLFLHETEGKILH